MFSLRKQVKKHAFLTEVSAKGGGGRPPIRNFFWFNKDKEYIFKNVLIVIMSANSWEVKIVGFYVTCALTLASIYCLIMAWMSWASTAFCTDIAKKAIQINPGNV